jgi:integrase/recombinase XerC
MLHLVGASKTESQEFKALRIERDAWLAEAGISQKTEVNYRAATDQLIRFLSERGSSLDRIGGKAFRVYLAGKGIKASTQRSILTAAKSFTKWRMEARGAASDAMALVSPPKADRTFTKRALTRAEAQKLVIASANLTIRNRAIVLLAMICGLRTIEISRANRGDISRIQNFDVLYVQGKGRADKGEFVVLPKEVRRTIDQLAASHDEEALFISESSRNPNQRLDTQTIRKMVKELFRSIGIDEEGVTAHSLRHTAASLALESGVEISLIQSSLRHRSIDTTNRYVHMAAIQKRLENNPETVVSKLLATDFLGSNHETELS